MIALLTGLGIVVEVCVVSKQSWSGIAIELVPPDTHEMLLRENCAVGAKEIESLVQSADVKHLAAGLNVSVITWELLLDAIERSFWDFRVDWIVDIGFAGNGRVIAFLALILLT